MCPTEYLVVDRATRLKLKVKYMSQFVKRVSRVIQKAKYHLNRTEIAQPGAMENNIYYFYFLHSAGTEEEELLTFRADAMNKVHKCVKLLKH